MSEKRYNATPEEFKSLRIMWVKKHRDVRFQFRITEKETELIRLGFDYVLTIAISSQLG